MSIVFVDPVGGLAGDMLVAALIDAGAPLEHVATEVKKLLSSEVELRTERVWRGPFSALRFVVVARGEGHAHDHAHGGSHSHGHSHGGSHVDEHLHASPPSGAPQDSWRLRSRRWSDIDALLAESSLAPRVIQRARAVFRRLAEAEGRVHGMPAEAVTFHEVGSVDSIADIVGACVALEWHDAERVLVGVLPLGHGHVLGEHGWIPLPAPATVELLRGLPVEGREIRGETVTPTGAALAAALMEPGVLPAMIIGASGVGAGTWDPASHPNVVRVLVGNGAAGAVAVVDQGEAEVDTLTGEQVPALIQALIESGAVDAYVTPILMKKGRAGWLITALCPPELRAQVGATLLREGRTLGVRWSRKERVVLERRHFPVETAWGQVRVKVGLNEGKVIHAAPEYEDCRLVAAASGVSIIEVQAAALAAWAVRNAAGGHDG